MKDKLIHFMQSKLGILLIIIFLSIPAIIPLTKPGFFPTHDFIHVLRLYEMDNILKDGQFPARWAPDLRYGEPLFNYYAPLPFYIGFIIHNLGFSFLDTTKILFAFSFILSGYLMYIFAKKLFNFWGALIAATLYIYAPYHSVDIYVRGALSESIALIFFPLIFLTALNLSKNINYKNVIYFALSLTGLFYTHNIMTMLFLPFVAIWLGFLIWQKKDWHLLKANLFTVLLAFGLSASFLLPAFFEKDLVQSSKLITGYFDFRGHFVELKQFFISPWGYGASLWGSHDDLSFQIGVIHWLMVAIGIILSIFSYLKNKKHFLWLIISLLLAFVFSLFMQHNKSTPIWLAIPPMAFTQFPWRFLGISIFFASIIGGLVGLYLMKYLKILGLVIVLLTIFVNIGYFHPESYYLDAKDEHYVSEKVLNTDDKLPKDYLPIWVKEIPSERIINPIIKSGKAEILSFIKRSKWSEIKVQALEESNIEIPITYFPGWKAWVDQKEIKIDPPTKLGLIKISVPSGFHTVTLKFTDTPIRTAANLISVFSLGLVLLLLTNYLKKYERKII